MITNYLKDKLFSKSLNFLLKQKDISIYEKIGYFVSNIIYSFVEYGKKGRDRGELFNVFL